MAHSSEAPQTSNEGGKLARLRQRVAAFANKMLFAEGSAPAPRVNSADKMAVPPTISGAGLAPVSPVIDTSKGPAAYRPSAADKMGVIMGASGQEPAVTRGAAEAAAPAPYTARNFPLGETVPAVVGKANGGYPQGDSPNVGRRETLFDDGGNLPPANAGVTIGSPEDIAAAYPGQQPRRPDMAGVIATGGSAPYHEGPYTARNFPHGEHAPAVTGRPDEGYPAPLQEPYAAPEGMFPPDGPAQPPALR